MNRKKKNIECDKMEEAKRIVSFMREDGKLVRIVEEEIPFILEQGGKSLTMSNTVTKQILDQEAEEKLYAFLKETHEAMETALVNMEKEITTLKHLGHEELTASAIDKFSEAIKTLKADPRKTKFHTENMEKLCGILFKKIRLKMQISEARNQLKAYKDELEKIGKLK